MLRSVLLVLGGNAVALAVFGTFEKLSGAGGLWFGLVPSPNPKFFSTFIYHNHWGAFTLLNTAVCLGLLFHHVRRGGQRDIWHSPVLLGALATLLLAATIPLSASRSCTALLSVLLFGALLHHTARLIRRRRERHESAALPAAGLVLAALLATAAIAYLGREVIAQRARLTTEQLGAIAKEETLNSRLTVYRDTWRMAAVKPWFGWGLESYAHVFRIYNTQRATESWFGTPFYAEAHNDWFQSLAEVGFVGTGLLALLVFLPLHSVPWRQVESMLPRYLLAGDALVLLYAWVEFPFANPAVMLTFWVILFCAVRYATLSLPAQRQHTS
jgi:O-antigen ligase